MLRKPCCLQTDGRADRRTNKVNPVHHPPTSLGGGMIRYYCQWLLNVLTQIMYMITDGYYLNTLRPIQNGRRFPDDIFKCTFFNENVWISIKISLNFVPKGPINNIPSLVQIMAWRRPGDKPLFEPMMVSLLTHICVTRPQWVKESFSDVFVWPRVTRQSSPLLRRIWLRRIWPATQPAWLQSMFSCGFTFGETIIKRCTLFIASTFKEIPSLLYWLTLRIMT